MLSITDSLIRGNCYGQYHINCRSRNTQVFCYSFNNPIGRDYNFDIWLCSLCTQVLSEVGHACYVGDPITADDRQISRFDFNVMNNDGQPVRERCRCGSVSTFRIRHARQVFPTCMVCATSAIFVLRKYLGRNILHNVPVQEYDEGVEDVEERDDDDGYDDEYEE